MESLLPENVELSTHLRDKVSIKPSVSKEMYTKRERNVVLGIIFEPWRL